MNIKELENAVCSKVVRVRDGVALLEDGREVYYNSEGYLRVVGETPIGMNNPQTPHELWQERVRDMD